MSITRPSAITPEELEKLVERMSRNGASITLTDPRVTSVQTWFLTTIGLTLVGLGGWGIKSINELNQTMTRVVTQNEYRDAQVSRIEKHLEVIDSRVGTLERKVR